MLNQAVLFLLDTLLTLSGGAFLLRFAMQRLRAPFRNPAGQFLLALTDFAVKPLRRIIPGMLGWDWASLVAAWLTQFLLVVATFGLQGHAASFPAAFGGLALVAMVTLLALCVHLLIWTVIVFAVLSWVQPHHWINGVVGPLVRPFLRPLQRLIPLIGGVDLSPLALILLCQLVLMLLCQLVLMLPIAWLQQIVVRLV